MRHRTPELVVFCHGSCDMCVMQSLKQRWHVPGSSWKASVRGACRLSAVSRASAPGRLIVAGTHASNSPPLLFPLSAGRDASLFGAAGAKAGAAAGLGACAGLGGLTGPFSWPLLLACFAGSCLRWWALESSLDGCAAWTLRNYELGILSLHSCNSGTLRIIFRLRPAWAEWRDRGFHLPQTCINGLLCLTLTRAAL